MGTSTTGERESARPRHYFATTHWTVVLAAGAKDTASSQGALEELCQGYWTPLYAFARRRGYTPEDAEDVTQEFFRRLLDRNSLQSADREKGRFRTFLLVAFKRFMANECDRAHAQKRGGAIALESFDTSVIEPQIDPSSDLTPERAYDRRWALALLEKAMARLRQEFVASGKIDEFEKTKTCLTADRGAIPYPEMAQALGMSEGAVRVSVHRLRRRFRDIFCEEISQTVATEAEIDEEVRYLLSVI